jgi:hypothetical protein
MKRFLLSGIVVLASATLLAQAPSSSSQATAPAGSTSVQTFTLTGCVGGGESSADGVTLSNAMVIPSARSSSSSASSSTAASPVPPSASAPTTAAGLSRAGKTASAAATSSRLSGADLSSWIGKRVQVVGSIVPGAAASAGSPASSVAGATGTSGSMSIPELRVESVQPVSNGPSCPEK